MIGKVIGAVAGAKLAEQARGISGPAGALIGAGAVALASRMKPLGLVLSAAGVYALKRYLDKNTARKTTPANPPAPTA